ncbi:hypothetical protein FACS1894158_16130 [Betaproteobacteria bacterium]|nr:hypothetical protein FACS1894158_16130 [Betaproteobacteria bacterium]
MGFGNQTDSLLFFLFNNFIGGADDNSLSERFSNLDLNNINSQIEFIKNELKPFFESTFSINQREELLMLLNDLSSGEIKIETNDFENQLFPFETPSNIQNFCNAIKQVLY